MMYRPEDEQAARSVDDRGFMGNLQEYLAGAGNDDAEQDEAFDNEIDHDYDEDDEVRERKISTRLKNRAMALIIGAFLIFEAYQQLSMLSDDPQSFLASLKD